MNFLVITVLSIVLLIGSCSAVEVDVSDAIVLVRSNRERVWLAGNMLSDEVLKRTLVSWPVEHTASTASTQIELVPRSDIKFENCYISAVPGSIRIEFSDDRGAFFGVGRLLRMLNMSYDESRSFMMRNVTLQMPFSGYFAPETHMRGHQLSYRSISNSYDSWDVARFEDYIRGLIVFGTNKIEMVAPDGDFSPHFPLPQSDMILALSKLFDRYDLNVSVWYPQPRNLNTPGDWGDILLAMTRLDSVFVPGGDPGSGTPDRLLEFLRLQAERLRTRHPHLEIWVSSQGFNTTSQQHFYSLLSSPQYTWLTGVSYGPHTRDTLEVQRSRIHKQYQLYHYPDVCHGTKAEYPSPAWSFAFGLTEQREVVNPRPVDFKHNYDLQQPFVSGFTCYSDGINDDMNKVMWSALGWQQSLSAQEVVMEYARYFFRQQIAAPVAQGIFALEQNWQGDILSNPHIDATLSLWQQLEASATPQDSLNWRFQLYLYRAYYDAYTQTRLVAERQQELQAIAILRTAPSVGAEAAMDKAVFILSEPDTSSTQLARRAKLHAISTALFTLIGMKLTIDAPISGDHIGRGDSMDTLQSPFNSRLWLSQQFTAIHQLGNEAGKLEAINAIVLRRDAPLGGFYDNLGDVAPHLVMGPGVQTDPSFYQSTLLSFYEPYNVTTAPIMPFEWVCEAFLC
eukprot:TRINITY_DN2303_c0_g1_i6.p1 TRINITY_DN2303_c0_g1~~TRINITY_DN2303_c0_g1_i6.p1  ORF type:complete len:679 (+),score=118.30 TRINITY_DN2303_c0_g1_i6:50-2086(+)